MTMRKLLVCLAMGVLAACGEGEEGEPGDTTPPVFVSSSPALGAADVEVDRTIAITFSEPIAAASAEGVQLLAPEGTSVEVERTVHVNRVELRPLRALLRNARYQVRMNELIQSLSIVEQLIDNIPEGDIQAKTKAVIKLPKGEFYSRVESARGEFGVYIVSEGGTTPYRIKFRSPGFSNLSALDQMARGQKIGDLVAMMGSLDLVIPDIDR